MAWKNLVVGLAVAVAACTGGGASPLKEVQRVRSGSTDVVLLSRDGAVKKGPDTFTLEFRSPGGDLVDVGTVTARATMPMAGMGTMAGGITVQPAEAKGRYTVSSDLTMVGTWRVDVEWNGPAGSGTATLSTAAQ